MLFLVYQFIEREGEDGRKEENIKVWKFYAFNWGFIYGWW